MSSGTLPPLPVSSDFSSLMGPASTSLISSSAGLPMIALARFTSLMPGSCTMIWSPAVPYGATTGSETPRLVDTPFDRLNRLRHRFAAMLHGDVRLHLVAVRSANAGRAVVGELDLLCRQRAGSVRSSAGGIPSTVKPVRLSILIVVSAMPASFRRSRSCSEEVSVSSLSASSVCTLRTKCTPPLRSRPSFTLRGRRGKRPYRQRGDGHNNNELPTQILVHELDPGPVLLDHGLLSLISADRGPRDVDADLVGDLELDDVVGDLDDLAMNAAGRDHPIARFQARPGIPGPSSAACAWASAR